MPRNWRRRPANSAALLAAFEKGDAEFLASVRARQELELAHLNLRVREDVWRDADWQVQALDKPSKACSRAGDTLHT